MRHGDRRRGHVVVARENSGGRLLASKQFFSRLETRSVREVPLLNESRIERDAGFLHGRLIALEAARAGGLVRVSLDEGDARVTELDEVQRHFLCGTVIVDPHARDIRLKPTGRDSHHRHPRSHELRSNCLRFAQRWGQDDAGDAGGKLAGGRFLARRTYVGPGIEHELRGRATRTIERADQKLGQIGRARIGVDETDARALRRCERTRRCIRRVVQFLHGTHDDLTRGFANIAVAVHDTRDGHGRYARMTRHLVNGYGIPFASDGLFHCPSLDMNSWLLLPRILHRHLYRWCVGCVLPLPRTMKTGCRTHKAAAEVCR